MNYYSKFMYGRKDIFTPVTEINETNILDVLNNALETHCENAADMDYLYWYRRGKMPIRFREKEVRPEINNKIIENHAEEIVAFKNGYFLTQNATYTARSSESQSDEIAKLNEYLRASGKHEADNEVVDWFHTVGKGVLYVTPNDDIYAPVKCYALDPRRAFVVRSLSYDKKPLMGVYFVIDEDTVHLDCYTEDKVFRVSGGTNVGNTTEDIATATYSADEIISVEPNVLGKVPIIEYRYNSVNMSAFEPVLTMLDAINDVLSNRVDGISQFIQSLCIATNCNFDDDVTANQIRQAGMIVLESTTDRKADFTVLSEQLNQSETQVALNDLYEKILAIVGMPSTTEGGTATSSTGAAVLARDGWYQADNIARNTEDLFKASNKFFDEIFLDILLKKRLVNLTPNEFELHFVRNETANIQSKAQTFATLVNSGLHPELALAKSGISNDPVADYEKSKVYIERVLKATEGDNATLEASEEVEIDES